MNKKLEISSLIGTCVNQVLCTSEDGHVQLQIRVEIRDEGGRTGVTHVVKYIVTVHKVTVSETWSLAAAAKEYNDLVSTPVRWILNPWGISRGQKETNVEDLPQ
jgi:hypothetical protein